jgi:hypothetical protein
MNDIVMVHFVITPNPIGLLSIYVLPHSTLPSPSDADLLETFYLFLTGSLIAFPDLCSTQSEHDLVILIHLLIQVWLFCIL